MLFRSLYQGNTTIPGELYAQIETVYKTRNIYAYTSPRSQYDAAVLIEADLVQLNITTKEAEQVEGTLLGMVVDFEEGAIPPLTSDDIADWPL